jgi:hypothetical protein
MTSESKSLVNHSYKWINHRDTWKFLIWFWRINVRIKLAIFFPVGAIEMPAELGDSEVVLVSPCFKIPSLFNQRSIAVISQPQPSPFPGKAPVV